MRLFASTTVKRSPGWTERNLREKSILLKDEQ